jgi:hypothetical protein
VVDVAFAPLVESIRNGVNVAQTSEEADYDGIDGHHTCVPDLVNREEAEPKVNEDMSLEDVGESLGEVAGKLSAMATEIGPHED